MLPPEVLARRGQRCETLKTSVAGSLPVTMRTMRALTVSDAGSENNEIIKYCMSSAPRVATHTVLGNQMSSGNCVPTVPDNVLQDRCGRCRLPFDCIRRTEVGMSVATIYEPQQLRISLLRQALIERPVLFDQWLLEGFDQSLETPTGAI
jgi:hypothetical protein